MTESPSPANDVKQTLTVKEAYEYEKNKQRLGGLSYNGFRTRVNNGVYPFYKLPGTKVRLIDIQDIEEMHLRARVQATRACFKGLRK